MTVSRILRTLVLYTACVISCGAGVADDFAIPPPVRELIQNTCVKCHNADTAEGGFDVARLSFELRDRASRRRWILIHDRIQRGEMPPNSDDLAPQRRAAVVNSLGSAIHNADLADVVQHGRGPMRRLNRDEYQQNLRDVLALPTLDIRDILPEDREQHLFNKTTETLDISRVQLTAYLEAAEAALLQAIASGIVPPATQKFRAVGRKLFQETSTFGNRQAMFFSRDSAALDNKQLDAAADDPGIELALFRSAHWPYYGYPRDFVAPLPGEYRVRFSARAVLQLPGFKLTPATAPQPMTFRARKRSGPDVSGDVRATGGLLDIQPQRATYTTGVRLLKTETFEYSLLGLPVPLARNVNNGPPTYRYPPFPKQGQPGVAIDWLEIEGPLSPSTWPPPSHRILFDELPIRASQDANGLPVEVLTDQPQAEARRLLRRFVKRAARRPVTDEALLGFEGLILSRLKQDVPFAEAMISGYQAFLCSRHVLYLREPLAARDHFAIASRLSHLLTNTRPDERLLELAARQQLRDPEILRSETQRLIASPGFDRFVKNFTDYWLNLKHLYRDEPHAGLYPEYRFDAYLVESMERETRTFFRAMVRDNLPASVVVKSDFAYVNDRLATHYRLAVGKQPIHGSAMRKVVLPADSPYGGLLTQAAVLKVTANGSSTSPVIRGAWVMERLLGQPPPPPPESVPAVEPDVRGAKTIRELLARHTQAKSCAECHARFDPVGFGLENYDILGGWRTRYRGLSAGQRITGIDRAGHDFAYGLTSAIDAGGQLPDGRRFDDIHQLKELLVADTRQLARNLLQQFTVYTTGTPVRFSDRREIERLLDTCAANGYRVGDLLQALVHSKIVLGPAGCGEPQLESTSP